MIKAVGHKLVKILLAACLLCISSTAFAQKACVVLSSNISPYREALRGFKETYRGAVREWFLEKSSDPGKVASDLSQSDCTVVVTMGSQAFKHMRLRISEKPLVFAMALSPSITGIEGREITGVYLEPSPRKTLEALKAALPRAAVVGALYSTATQAYMDEAKKAAGVLGLTLNVKTAATVGELARQAPALIATSDVVWMIPDPVTSSQIAFQTLLQISLNHSIPVFALSQKYVSAGAIAALTSNYAENGKQAGTLALHVSQGRRASSIVPEFAKVSGLTVNLKTAQRLGFSIPDSVITKAVEIYR